jgi:dihydrofolate synthase/folylpolyglutamate synthase
LHEEEEALRAYRAANARLDRLIDPAGGPPRGDLAAVRARAERRLDRLHRFLQALADPHEAFPIVHVAGTSGKGSTAATIAAILSQAGYRVGLHTSPYLQVATEKLLIDGAMIGASPFADLVDRTLADAGRWAHASGEARLSYGEVWAARASAPLAAWKRPGSAAA